MNSYHFDVGNSSKGPVGFCARVKAENEKEAVSKLRNLLEHSEHFEIDLAVEDRDKGIEYLNFYVNPAYVFESDIDDSEPVEEEQ